MTAVETEEPKMSESEGYVWIETNSQNCHRLEYKAVQVGTEGHDGSPIYVGRTNLNGEVLPCKVLPRHNVAYTSRNGKDIAVHNFEMFCMCGPRLRWITCSNGEIPLGAVEVGRTADGEPLYVGRAMYKGSLTPGRVQQSHKVCYLAFGGKEVAIKSYEVMILKHY